MLNMNPDNEFEYITYCGKLNREKDGVDILVEAYCRSIESGKIPGDVKLMLIGDFINDTFRTSLKSIINEKNCDGNIIFAGKMAQGKGTTFT